MYSELTAKTNFPNHSLHNQLCMLSERFRVVRSIQVIQSHSLEDGDSRRNIFAINMTLSVPAGQRKIICNYLRYCRLKSLEWFCYVFFIASRGKCRNSLYWWNNRRAKIIIMLVKFGLSCLEVLFYFRVKIFSLFEDFIFFIISLK